MTEEHDNSEHEREMTQMVEDHFDLMRLVDRVEVIKCLRHALDDPDKTIDGIVKHIYDARVKAYKMGGGTYLGK